MNILQASMLKVRFRARSSSLRGIPNHLFSGNPELRTFNFQPVCLWTQAHGNTRNTHADTRKKHTKHTAKSRKDTETHAFFYLAGFACRLSLFSFSSLE